MQKTQRGVPRTVDLAPSQKQSGKVKRLEVVKRAPGPRVCVLVKHVKIDTRVQSVGGRSRRASIPLMIIPPREEGNESQSNSKNNGTRRKRVVKRETAGEIRS